MGIKRYLEKDRHDYTRITYEFSKEHLIELKYFSGVLERFGLCVIPYPVGDEESCLRTVIYKDKENDCEEGTIRNTLKTKFFGLEKVVTLRFYGNNENLICGILNTLDFEQLAKEISKIKNLPRIPSQEISLETLPRTSEK